MVLINELANEVAAKVISRHFVYNPQYNKFERGYYTGKNDGKCVECDRSFGRRLKDAPIKLVMAIVQKFKEQLEDELNPENGRFVCEPAAFVKGGTVYKELEKMGEDAVHTWLGNETYFASRCVRRVPRFTYDYFASRKW
jgi:hypothetical protein